MLSEENCVENCAHRSLFLFGGIEEARSHVAIVRFLILLNTMVFLMITSNPEDIV
jgi:hypothetical protein